VKGLDESLRNARACRKDLLKILDYFCSPADQDTEIPAADCNKIKQNDVKQIAAPPLVLPKLASGDTTTENHTETG
jgi:hypothetical protein